MTSLDRDPPALTRRRFDLSIVGGGILGACLALEAVRRGLSCALLERADFGSQTTYNSLRIIHGGLRYLQSCDLPRFFESVAERRWFLRVWPDLVRPLPCLMPLYGEGVKRAPVMRLAFALNDLLSRRRNEGLRPDRLIPRARVVEPEAAAALWPGVARDGLEGGAIWHDACIPNSQRLVIEIIRWACERGAVAVNYVEGRWPDRRAGDADLVGFDRESGETFPIRTDVVVAATGPWAWDVPGASGDRRRPHFSLAWNLLVDRPAPSEHALAVTPREPQAQTYFLHPWKGRLLIGTGHAPWPASDPSDARPAERQVFDMLETVNRAAPSLALGPRDVLRVFAGLLPAKRAGSAALSARPLIMERPAAGGGPRFISATTVKLTTARALASRLLRQIFPGHTPDERFYMKPRTVRTGDAVSLAYAERPDLASGETARELRAIAEQESVVHLDDLVLRRTALGDNPERAKAVCPDVLRTLGWDGPRAVEETARVRDAIM